MELSVELREKLRRVLLACVRSILPILEHLIPKNIEQVVVTSIGDIPEATCEVMEHTDFTRTDSITSPTPDACGDMLKPITFDEMQKDWKVKKHLKGHVSIA
jgi:hypothetical protein